MGIHRKRFGATSQTVGHVPTTLQSAPTYAIHDLMVGVDDADYVLDSGSATVDTASTTTTAAAGPSTANAKSLPVGLTTAFSAGLIQRQPPVWATYEVVDTDTGLAELVEVVAKDSSTLRLRNPLTRSYGSGSTVRGVRMTAPIADAVLAERERVDYDEPLRVVWQYGTTSVQEQIRIVRHEDGDVDFVAIQSDIMSLFPDIRTRTDHHERDTLSDVIAACYRQVRAHLQRDGVDMTRSLAGESLHWAVVWWTLAHEAAMGNHPGEGIVLDNWITQCRESRDSFLAGLRTGPGGKDTAKISRGTEAATATTDPEYRRIIRRQ